MVVFLPASFASELLVGEIRPLVVYELQTTDATTLRYSSQQVTWNSNTYTRLAVQQSEIIEEMSPRVPEVTVTFSNVANTLRDYFEPTDKLTGQRMTIRLLLRDSSWAVFSDSLILFVGFMERPRKVDQEALEITAVGLLQGRRVRLPGRTFSTDCTARFADAQARTTADSGATTTINVNSNSAFEVNDVVYLRDDINNTREIQSLVSTTQITVDTNVTYSANDPVRIEGTIDCNYNQNTTTANSGTNSTYVQVQSGGVGTEDAVRNRFAVGDYIKIGDNARATILSLIGQTYFEINLTQTWSAGDPVRHDYCDHTWSACAQRLRRQEYLGFLGMDSLRLDTATLKYAFSQFHPLFPPSGFLDMLDEMAYARRDRETVADVREAVPLIYGNRKTSGRLIDARAQEWPGTSERILNVSFHALSEGPIDGVEQWLADGEVGNDTIEEGYKSIGAYYRLGSLGEEGTEDTSDYFSDPDTLVRPQNMDWTAQNYSYIYLNPGDAEPTRVVVQPVSQVYSRLAYAIFRELEDPEHDNSVASVQFDVKGRTIQRYTATGSKDGNETFSRNPIWHAVDLISSRRYGQGIYLDNTDFSFEEIKSSADYCDGLISGPITYIKSVNTALPNYYHLDDVSDFFRGQIVLYDGASYTNETDEVVHVMPEFNRLVLKTSRTNQTVGDTIRQYYDKWTSDIVLTSSQDANAALHTLLRSCAGFITYDSGQIQLRVEKAEGASVGHFKDTGYSGGYAIVADSFEWLTYDDLDGDPRANKIAIKYINDSGDSTEHIQSDWDDIQSNPAIIDDVNAPGVKTKAHAIRLAKIELDKRTGLRTGASFVVGPIGLKLQPGDVIEVTHAVPNWSGAFKRVYRTERIGLGDDQELMVRVTVRDYDSTVYGDPTPPNQFATEDDLPVITLQADEYKGNRILLTWTVDKPTPFLAYHVFKSRTTITGDGPITPRLLVGRTKIATYIYTPRDTEIGQALYFVVVGRTRSASIRSNVASAVAETGDPTDRQYDSPINLVYGGDFNDALLWTLTEASGSETAFDADVNISGTWNSPDNAHDNDTSTNSSSSSIGAEQVWGWATSAVKDGRVDVDCESTPSIQFSYMNVYYSSDGGTNHTLIEQVRGNQGRKTVSKTLYGVNLTDTEVKVVRYGALGQSNVYEIDFMEFTQGPPYALIDDNSLVLQGDNTTTSWAEAVRPFPHLDPDETFVLRQNDWLTTRVQGRFPDTSNDTGPVEIVLQNDAGYTMKLLTLMDDPAPDPGLSTTWQLFVSHVQHTVGTQPGPWEISVRSRTNDPVEVDKLAVFLGQTVYDWMPSPQEMATYMGDRRSGKPGRLQRGRAEDVALRSSTVEDVEL